MVSPVITSKNSISSSPRRLDLDWLRIFAVLLLVPFHSALIYVQDPNSIMYVKDVVDSQLLDRMAGFIHRFHMPLLFVISGASTYFALRLRSAGKYLKERLLRLLIPAIFAIVLLLPPMTFLTRLSRGESVSFWQHFTGFFRLEPNDLAGYYGTLTPAHTWFIIFLFVFSVLALPFFLLEKKANPHNRVKGLWKFFSTPLGVFLLVIPLALAAAPDILGDKNPLYYFMTFLAGYLLMTDPAYQKSIDRVAWIAVVIGLVFEIARQIFRLDLPEWTMGWIFYGLMEQSIRWFLVIGILGIGHRFLTFGGSVQKYLSEVAFPFYILHLPINTLVAFLLVKLPLPVSIEYGLIVLLTMLATLAVVELCRRSAILNFIFGIKQPKKPQKSFAPESVNQPQI